MPKNSNGFSCERCGKKLLISNGSYKDNYSVSFKHGAILDSCADVAACGYVCAACHKDFIELAESFFDDLNKESDLNEAVSDS